MVKPVITFKINDKNELALENGAGMLTQQYAQAGNLISGDKAIEAKNLWSYREIQKGNWESPDRAYFGEDLDFNILQNKDKKKVTASVNCFLHA